MSMRRMLAAAALSALATSPALAADLTIFDWAGYEDPGFYPEYAATHETPNFAFFGDEEEAFQKMRAGFRADIAHPCSQSVPKWMDAGMLKPLDTARIEGWDKLEPAFRDMPSFMKDGKHYFLPADWGTSSLTYNPEIVPAADAQSLQIFADPKYAGRISIPDNVDDAYALAFLATGVSDWSNVTDEQFAAASDFLRAVQPNVVAYWTDGAGLAQLMASKEVVLAWAWNETVATMGWEGYPIAQNMETDEGAAKWVCGYSLMAGGEGDEDKAYEFLSSWAGEASGKYLIENWGYGHANTDAMNSFDESFLASVGLTPTDKPVLWMGPMPVELRENMIAEFEMIKAGF